MERQISPHRVSSIAVHSDCLFNVAVIKLAAKHQVPILFFNPLGTIQARLWSPYFVNIAALRKKQLLFSLSAHATGWVLEFIQQKTENQTVSLRRLAERTPRFKNDIEKMQIEQQDILEKLWSYRGQKIADVRNELLGYEGNLSKQYFQALNLFLPMDFQFEKRSRRPGLDYFNAALNYLYGMTYSVVESGVFAKGLDPFIGIMHTDMYKKPTLVYDLIEPIRPLIDRLLVALVREGKLLPEHFVEKPPGFWMSKPGKRLLISSFNELLQTRMAVGGNTRRLKDHIYAQSNQLGNLIEQTISL